MILATSKNGVWLNSKGNKTHFKTNELACPCCGMSEISQDLIDKLEFFRIYIDKPLKINSGCRCPVHNKKIGGSKQSNHLPITTAVDVSLPTRMSIGDFFISAVFIFNGVGLYKGNSYFIHADLRNTPLYWYRYKDKYHYFKSANKCFQNFINRGAK